MSFYTYYGKVKDELFVAVLPYGTVEQDDPVFVYSKKQFSNFHVRTVTCLDDGEDRFTFQDNYYTYTGTSIKGYRELTLKRKNPSGDSTTIDLHRHYDQPYSASPIIDPPKVWVGSIDFHKWAQNESFIVIAPKGLGVDKPIVSIWQWTADDAGTRKTLSYWTAKQQSAKDTPGSFTFKQGDYYTLTCSVDSNTEGLNVSIASPSNETVNQSILQLSAKVSFGAEHSFTPVRTHYTKLEWDCSLPQDKPSLPRIRTPLPFPEGLVETLSYSAAYVDQAGYLAKYAIKSFNKLETSFRQLDKKSEARGTKIIKLESENSQLSSDKSLLVLQFAELQRQLEEVTKSSEEREKSLNEKLIQTQKDLAVSESRVTHLETLIKVDQLSDAAREEAWEQVKKTAEEKLDHLVKDLHESQAKEKSLRDKLSSRESKIRSLETEKKHLEEQLVKAKKTISELQLEVKGEKDKNVKLSIRITEIETEITETQTNVEEYDRTIKRLRLELRILEQDNSALEENKKEQKEATDAAVESEAAARKELKEIKDVARAAEKDARQKKILIEELRLESNSLYEQITKLKSSKTETSSKKSKTKTTVTEISV